MKNLLRKIIKYQGQGDLNLIIDEIQSDVRFAQTPLLNCRSSAEMILSFKANARFNLLQRISKQQSTDKINENDHSLLSIGQKVWCRNAPYKHPNYVLAEVIKRKGDRLLEVIINERKRTVPLDQIRKADLQFKIMDTSVKTDWWRNLSESQGERENNKITNQEDSIRRSQRGFHPKKHYRCEGY